VLPNTYIILNQIIYMYPLGPEDDPVTLKHVALEI
jgi:hypothetical protein